MNRKERVIELLDEVKNLICDDIETDSTCYGYNRYQWINYAGALNALVNGKDYRLRLIDVGYEFDEQHTLEDVLQYEFNGDGYAGGASIKPEISQDECRLPEVVFTGISGVLYGAVFCSDTGPISFLVLGKQVLSDSTVVILCKSD